MTNVIITSAGVSQPVCLYVRLFVRSFVSSLAVKLLNIFSQNSVESCHMGYERTHSISVVI